MAQMEQTTQTVAASAEEGASAAAELDMQSQHLAELVADLNATISGG